MWQRLGLIIATFPAAAAADSVVALRTLPAQSVVSEADITLVAADIDGALTALDLAVGLEVKTTIYAGRPLRPEDIGAPALVDRNQIVSLIFKSGSLTIAAEGRALQRGAEGDVIRVMNLESKSTVSGRITPDGRVTVGDLN